MTVKNTAHNRQTCISSAALTALYMHTAKSATDRQTDVERLTKHSRHIASPACMNYLNNKLQLSYLDL